MFEGFLYHMRSKNFEHAHATFEWRNSGGNYYCGCNMDPLQHPPTSIYSGEIHATVLTLFPSDGYLIFRNYVPTVESTLIAPDL